MVKFYFIVTYLGSLSIKTKLGIKVYTMEEFEEYFFLDDDENYEKICGEIILTTKRRVVMHCTICEAKFQGFEAYINHFFVNHEEIDTSSELDEKLDMEEISPYELWEDLNDCNDEGTIIKLEIDPLQSNEFSTIEGTIKDQSKGNSIKSKHIPENEQSQNATTKLQLEQIEGPIKDQPKRNAKKSKHIPEKEPSENAITKPELVQIEIEKVVPNNEEFPIPDEIRPILKRRPFIGKNIPEEERVHKCPICGLGFREKYNLRHHFRRHSHDKNHTCSECGKKFYTFSDLKVHQKFHSSNREYLCTYCGRGFRKSSHLTLHIKRHKNQRDHKCPHDNCDKAYFDTMTLKTHIRSHTKERPFACPKCKSTFGNKNALRNHLKLHENKLAYKCKVCDAGFNQQAGLFSHMKTVHKAA